MINPPPPSKNRLISDDSDDAPIVPVSQITTPVPPAPVTAPPRRRRKNNGKSAYPGRRQITAHVPENLYRWMRTISVATDKTMVLLLEEAVDAYVRAYAGQKQFQTPL